MLDDLNTKLMSFLRIMALAVVLGLSSVAPVYAQDDVADEVTPDVVAEEEDDGFDWGLLGLLGLLGLAGLMKKNDTTTRVDRTVDPGIDTVRR